MFSRAALSALRANASRSFSTAARRQASSRTAQGGAAAATALAAGVVGAALYSQTKPVYNEGPRTIAGEHKTTSERSYIMIKPDGTSRQLVGKIISRFEEKGYKLVAIKSVVPSDALAKEHYADLAEKPFFAGLVKYITSGTPVICMIWEGRDIVKQGRRIVGATNPQQSEPGTVRFDYAASVGRNLIHASDSFESATKEIGLWFAPEELAEYEPCTWQWTQADN